MVVKGKNLRTIENILIGEVWVCSGQSNMEFNLSSAIHAEEEIASSNYPEIRLFTVKKRIAQSPQENLEEGEWWNCSPISSPHFSAVAYFFGRELYRKLKVPIGLINTSWGGTVAETWTSPETISNNPDFAPMLENLKKIDLNEYGKSVEKELRDRLGEYSTTDQGTKDNEPIWAAAGFDDQKWKTMPLPGSQMGVIIREPSGVVGLITPWNFPALLAIAWKAAPALCCGNSVVIKPSELTSLTALAIAHLGVRAGLPAGVLNVITGSGADAGAALANHPGVDVLAFTGGPVTGRKVLRARAELLRPALLELGGKSPNIVFADADLAQAVAGAAFGIYYNQGENCNAGSRVLVHEDVYDAFLAGLEVAAKRIRVLPPLDEACAKWVPSSPQPTWRRWRRTWRSASRRARGSSRAVSVPLALALRAAIFSRPPCLQMCCPATVSSRRRYSGPS